MASRSATRNNRRPPPISIPYEDRLPDNVKRDIHFGAYPPNLLARINRRRGLTNVQREQMKLNTMRYITRQDELLRRERRNNAKAQREAEENFARSMAAYRASKSKTKKTSKSKGASKTKSKVVRSLQWLGSKLSGLFGTRRKPLSPW